MTSTPRHDIPQDDPEIARLSEMVVALLSELSIVTERLDTVERLLERTGALRRADIETFEPDAEAADERGRRRLRQLDKIFRPLRLAAERAAAELTPQDSGDRP